MIKLRVPLSLNDSNKLYKSSISQYEIYDCYDDTIQEKYLGYFKINKDYNYIYIVLTNEHHPVYFKLNNNDTVYFTLYINYNTLKIIFHEYIVESNNIYIVKSNYKLQNYIE